MIADKKSIGKTVVVIGNGMVGHRFCERLVQFDQDQAYRVVTFCEESRPAYNRVGLSSYFESRNEEQLMLTSADWYRKKGMELHVGDRVVEIDRAKKEVRSAQGRVIAYDYVVLATGSSPFVPPVDGIKKEGIFVYRTIEDLERIIAYSSNARTAAVIGGGLLGLEAAKATLDLGLETHVIEFASRLMPRQVDEAGSRMLLEKIEKLGVKIHLNKVTKQVLGNGQVDGLSFADGENLQVDMVVVSAGIRPRDELARACGLEVGDRGGVVVNDHMQTSDPDIFAIGEVALHGGMIYGLVAPGYEMAEVLASNLARGSRTFARGDLSTKLKLMGVDVASFGDYTEKEGETRSVVLEEPIRGVYKKLVFSYDGTRLRGGMLVGDASDYTRLLALSKSADPLDRSPVEVLLGPSGSTSKQSEPSADAQICSCNNVSKGQICSAIREQGLSTISEVKACTKAGTGCGGCLPQVTQILNAELERAGRAVKTILCEHFKYTRQELFQIIKVKRIKTFDDLLSSHGQGHGCEICKPAVASILASLWNEHIVDHATLQDTNDRFLANMQRGGLYSVVPRVPGGEITPDKLIALGAVAKKYGLYTKITGGQRIDLFGAQLHQLPDIWEELIAAGFESGHAYGKALRTIKSCVGSTWCRYGVQDSVGFAIRIEERYRGIRAPHKLKGGVSGCIRECAEARGKDFGLIATEKGYNLYVCGNGGASPRHADLLASDLDEETCIRYLDRFLMFYIQTADKLTRTAAWLEQLEGGLAQLKSVVVDDSLGIAQELEARMQDLVDSYRCEWKEAVTDPAKRSLFTQFVNTRENEPDIELIDERGQTRPVNWPEKVNTDKVDTSLLDSSRRSARLISDLSKSWVCVGKVDDFPVNGGATVKYGKTQIAVFNFASRGEWYACQNRCPHMNAFVLSRGIIGDAQGAPKVACPLHKRNFSLRDGTCLTDDSMKVKVFPVRVSRGEVYLELPPQRQLDTLLATELHRIGSCAGACHKPALQAG